LDNMFIGKRILVVEDEIMLAMMMEDVLADLGCTTVQTAGTCSQALDLMDHHTFDAAMLDINLGGTTSKPVAEALAEKSIPFVFCTGNSQSVTWDGFQDRPFLRKPYDFKELESVLAKLFVAPS
jgi:CheY-like chemotaxis protein